MRCSVVSAACHVRRGKYEHAFQRIGRRRSLRETMSLPEGAWPSDALSVGCPAWLFRYTQGTQLPHHGNLVSAFFTSRPVPSHEVESSANSLLVFVNSASGVMGDQGYHKSVLRRLCHLGERKPPTSKKNKNKYFRICP